MMLEEISRLDAMVERLLYFARPLNLNVELFDLVALAHDCVEARQALIRSDSIHMLYQPGDANVTVRGDRAKLRQVLDNVLSNALEALDSGGTVDVKVFRARLCRLSAEAAGAMGTGLYLWVAHPAEAKSIAHAATQRVAGAPLTKIRKDIEYLSADRTVGQSGRQHPSGWSPEKS